MIYLCRGQRKHLVSYRHSSTLANEEGGEIDILIHIIIMRRCFWNQIVLCWWWIIRKKNEEEKHHEKPLGLFQPN